jgi:hypothetical protein
LEICAFDIQSGWRDAFERKREYMRRDIFMGKLNPKNFSQRLQDLNKYLDYIPIERTTMAYKTQKAYGKSLPDDEIRSIMRRAIPSEWTVNLLDLGKELWRLKYLEDQLNMYRQQWKADQQKQMIVNMEKIMKETIIIPMVVVVAVARAILDEEDAEEAQEVAAEEAATIVSI